MKSNETLMMLLPASAAASKKTSCERVGTSPIAIGNRNSRDDYRDRGSYSGLHWARWRKSDYPELFGKDVMIVIGKNTRQMNIGWADAITEDLFDFTGNMPVIRDDATIAEDEWKLCPAELQCVTLETEHFIKGRTLRSFRTEKTIEHIQGNK